MDSILILFIVKTLKMNIIILIFLEYEFKKHPQLFTNIGISI